MKITDAVLIQTDIGDFLYHYIFFIRGFDSRRTPQRIKTAIRRHKPRTSDKDGAPEKALDAENISILIQSSIALPLSCGSILSGISGSVVPGTSACVDDVVDEVVAAVVAAVVDEVVTAVVDEVAAVTGSVVCFAASTLSP